MTPGHEFLAAPAWLITGLHVLTLTLHLAAMGTVFGGVGMLLLTQRRERWSHPVILKAVELLPSLMAATVTLGVAPLLFLQLVYHRQVYAASIVSAWWWLGVVGAVILAYSSLYAASFSTADHPSRVPRLLLASLVLLLFVSFVFTSVFALAERPETMAEVWAESQTGLALHPETGRWIPRWLHMIAGALTLGAFALGLAVRDHADLFVRARRGFALAMVSAILLGFAALIGIADHIAPYMRSSAPWWLLGSFAFAVASIAFLHVGRLSMAGASLFVSLLGMVAQRHVARLVVLDGAVDPGAMVVRPQWGVFALFLGCFVLMIGVVVWMLRVFLAHGPDRRLEGVAES